MKNALSLVAILVLGAPSLGNGYTNSINQIAKMLRSDVRVICIGDSYSTAYWSRVGMAGLRVWPIPRISAIGGGSGNGSTIIQTNSTCSPYETILSADPLGYTVDRQSDTTHFFSLPIRGIKEIYTSNDFSVNDKTGNLFQLNLNVEELGTGVHGSFSESDDILRFRFLYRSPFDPQNQPESLLIKDGNETVLSFDPRNDARKLWHLNETPNGTGRTAISSQLNAVAIDTSAVNQLEELCRMYIAQDIPLQNTNAYFQLAGGVYYHADEIGDPVDGLYFSSIADNSWSYAGFGSDTEGTSTHDKQFSLEQFTYWLDVTTLKRDQPVLFVWMFNVEVLGISAMRQQHVDMIDQADAAIDHVGISQSYHLIITPHMYNFSDGGDKAHAYMQQHQDIATELSKTRENVATISIYSATDGILFNGTNVANDWLIDHGFDAFEFGSNIVNLSDKYYGNLLDSWVIHPKNEDSAAFFAAIVGNEIRKAACPADVNGDGFVNVNDLLEIIGTLGECEGCSGDINGDGIVDVSDLLYVASFIGTAESSADVNGDGFVNVNDLLEIIGTWGECESCSGDINGDGTTNVVDVLSVIDTWGDCWPVQAPFNTPAF